MNNIYLAGECPAKYRWAYSDGEYCCKTPTEKVASNKGHSPCDGSSIAQDSDCCENDSWHKCWTPPCTNNEFGKSTNKK